MDEFESGLSCQVFKVATRHPGDVAGVIGLLEGGEVRAEDIVAIFGKPEGNGCVNDFTRAYAVPRSPRPSRNIWVARRPKLPPASPWSCRAVPKVDCPRIC